jgi:hypothetical protein
MKRADTHISEEFPNLKIIEAYAPLRLQPMPCDVRVVRKQRGG